MSAYEAPSVAAYEVGALRGEGASSVVWAATETSSGRRVALKVLRPSLSGDATSRARWARQVRAHEEVQHPHLCPVLAHGELSDGRPWLAMPLLEGPSLRALLEAHPRGLAPERAWALLRALGEALVALHARGFVHRDVKPENVRVGEGDAEARELALLDLGLAGERKEALSTTLTQSGEVLGTPAYLSPEQCWGAEVGPAADQYALGVLAFELLAGRRPFEEEGWLALVTAQTTHPAPSLASVGVACGDAVEAWVARLLSKKPEARFASMEEALREGERVFSSPKELRGERAPRRLLGAAVALAVTALPFLAGYGGIHSPTALMRLAGWPFFLAAGAWGAGLLALLAGRGGAGWALLPVGAAAFGSLANHQAVLAYLGRLREPASAFEVLQLGTFESEVLRVLGPFAGLALLLGSAWSRGGEAPSPSLRRAAHLLAGGACVALWLGAPAAALCLAGQALLLAAPTQGRGWERAAPVALALGLLFVATSSVAAARGALAWTEAPSRAARVREVVAAAREARGVYALTALAAAGLFWAALPSLRGAPKPRWTTARAVLAAGAGLVLLVDGGHQWRLARFRWELWQRLSPEFAWDARLRPPLAPASAGTEARLGSAVRLASDGVALGDARVLPLEALRSAQGRAVLASALGPFLARHVRTSAEREVPAMELPTQLSVVADRGLSAREVARVLSLAAALGVRRAQLVLDRAPAPALPLDAPVEAAWRMPRDCAALELALDPELDWEGPAEESVRDLARRWLAQGASPLRVGAR